MKNLLQHHMPTAKMMIYIIVFIVCFALAMGLLNINSLRGTLQQQMGGTSATPMDMSGAWLKLEAPTTTVATGEEVTFTVMADSNSADINGFDVLFEYDPNVLEIKKVNSLIPYFDIYTFDKNPTYLSITGTKKMSAETTAVIENSALIEIVARAKQPGSAQVRILPDMKMENTKMVTTKIEKIIPAIGEGLTITVN